MALLDTLGGKDPGKKDGFTAEQRFFIGFGQIWCQNVTPERARTDALRDPHSPGKYRVNGVLANTPELRAPLYLIIDELAFPLLDVIADRLASYRIENERDGDTRSGAVHDRLPNLLAGRLTTKRLR